MTTSNIQEATPYYEVNLKMYPWNNDGSSIGLYSTKSLATRVANFVRITFINEFNGGIDVSLCDRATKNEVTQFGENRRFLVSQPGKMGAIYTIFTNFNRDNVIHIVNNISSLITINRQSLPDNSPIATEQPSLVKKCDCYALYESTTNKSLGFYSSENALNDVIKFLAIMNITYTSRFENRTVIEFKSGYNAIFPQNIKQGQIENQSLMQVANRLDLFEVKRIIRSLGYKESGDLFLNPL